MTAYIRTLCCHCRRPIGRHLPVEYVNEDTGLTFMWHLGGPRDCWNESFFEIRYEYFSLMFRLQKKELA